MDQNRLKRKRDEEPSPPSWEALYLVGPYMDPKSLCAASCVSTTWYKSFSSEELWKIKRDNYESYNFTAYKSTTTSYKRQVVSADKSAKRSRKAPPKISLSDLTFTVYVSSGSKKAEILKQGKDLVFDESKERFQIEADVSESRIVAGTKEGVRMVLLVTCLARDTMFKIVEFTGSSLETSNSGWLTKELDTPQNSFTGTSDLVGDIKTSFNGEVLDKVGFAFLNSRDNSSLFLDDVLRYLQCFLLD